MTLIDDARTASTATRGDEGARSHAIAGRLDAHRVPEVRAQLVDGEGRTSIVLDLHDTTFVDLAGLDLLTELAAECRRRGQDFRISRLSPPVRIILELVGGQDLLASWPGSTDTGAVGARS